MNDTVNQAAPIEYHTDIGYFVWYPNWQAIEELLFKPLRKAVADANQKSRFCEADFLVRQYLHIFLLANQQCAVLQAAEEMIALAKGTATLSKHKRNKIAESAADKARQASIARLRKTHYFPEVGRGEKEMTTEAQKAMSEILEKYLGFERQVIETIKLLLRAQNRKQPTMSDVAEKLGMGTKQTKDNYNDTGERMLSRKLKNLRSGKQGKAIFNELVKIAKSELTQEHLKVRELPDRS